MSSPGERGGGGLSPIVGGEERVLGDDVMAEEEVVLGEDAVAEEEDEVLVASLPRVSLGEKTWFRV